MDSTAAAEKINAMWTQLGDVIAAAISQHVDAGNPVEAIRWATCAEACFWKATGEADTHDVKDVVPRYTAGMSENGVG